MRQATVICVLGMSRSGTSLTARLLSLAGVYLGRDEDLLDADLLRLPEESRAAARRANPGGFWEHYPLMRLNERILRRMGGNWREPPPLPPGWEESAELAPEREEARALLDAAFAGHDLWGWKDPRNSLTLPFWQRLLPEMRHVVCLRNPLDVGASLERRDGMPIARGIDLWRTYVAAALLNTAGRRRLLISYESYFDNPHLAAARLARFAGRDGALDGPGAGRQVAEAVDERLWRNRTPANQVVCDDRLPSEALSLFLLAELQAVVDLHSGRAA